MSYILDALRKADAERERGTVPGIHAQPMFAGASPAGPVRGPRPWLWALVAAVGVALVAALLWALIGREAPRGAVAPAVAVASTPAAAPALAAPALAGAPSAAALALPTAALAPTPAPTPAPRKPRPVAAAPRHAGDTAASLANPKATLRAAASATAAAPESRVYTVNELPADIRRQLPAVAIGGSRYSPSKADRLLIVNGQVVHEGDAIAPGLVLEQIKLKAAVLEYKGYRYAVTY